LIRHIGTDHPIYGIQARTLTRPDYVPTSIAQMAADYVDEICRLDPTGPVCLVGWSFGGLAAHAMATTLQARVLEVGLLAILASYPISAAVREEFSDMDDETALEDLLAAVLVDEIPDMQFQRPLTLAAVAEVLRKQANPLSLLDVRRFQDIAQVYAHNARLMLDFTPERFHGNLLLFTATVDKPENAPTPEAWRPYVDGAIEVHAVGSRHSRMAQPESLAQIGPVLAAKLSKVGVE